MTLKLGRTAGVLVGLVLWGVFLGPTVGTDPAVVFFTLLICAFGGLYLGTLMARSLPDHRA